MRARLWLQVGQLEFFPDPVHHVVDRKLEQQLDFAVLVAAFAVRTGILFRLAALQYVAGLALALAGPALGAAFGQAEAGMLE